MLSPEVHATALTAHPSPEAFALADMRAKKAAAAEQIRQHTAALLEAAAPNGVVRPADSRAAHAAAYQHVTQQHEIPPVTGQLH
jgi:hypothetical protein